MHNIKRTDITIENQKLHTLTMTLTITLKTQCCIMSLNYTCTMSPNVATCRSMLPYVAQCCHMSLNVAICRSVTLTLCHSMRPYVDQWHTNMFKKCSYIAQCFTLSRRPRTHFNSYVLRVGIKKSHVGIEVSIHTIYMDTSGKYYAFRRVHYC